MVSFFLLKKQDKVCNANMYLRSKRKRNLCGCGSQIVLMDSQGYGPLHNQKKLSKVQLC